MPCIPLFLFRGFDLILPGSSPPTSNGLTCFARDGGIGGLTGIQTHKVVAVVSRRVNVIYLTAVSIFLHDRDNLELYM